MDANKLLRSLAEIKETLNVPKNIKIIRDVLVEKSLYLSVLPRAKRKSLSRRTVENIWWYIRHLEPCRYYNSYGFDIVGLRKQKNYIPYRRFRIERNNENYEVSPFHPYKNQTIILRDKILFSSFFGQLLGPQYIIENLGYIEQDSRVYDLREHKYTTLIDFVNKYPKDLFVKKLFGECGDGCYLLNKSMNNILDIVKGMKGSTYIIQPRLEQHKALNEINSSCVNTIRIVTVRSKRNNKVSVLAHFIRFGTQGFINDNRATGGIAVEITSHGILGKWGIGHHSLMSMHPNSQKQFEGCIIPNFELVKELVIRAHNLLPNIVSIGWDVAITPTGPVLLEGNDNWEISGPQDTTGGLKEKWYQLHN